MNFITTFVLDSVLCEDHKPGKLHARVIMTVQLHCIRTGWLEINVPFSANLAISERNRGQICCHNENRKQVDALIMIQ